METSQEKHKAIIDEINEMHRVDQEMRTRYMKDGIEMDFNVDVENTKRAKEIIEEIGYPTISKVGKEASHNFWILIQHADHDREFQKYCLGLMRESADDISSVDIAYLEDRVRLCEGRPLLYGTQYRIDKDTNEMIILPIEDEEGVDKRRAEVGLPSLKEYIEMSNKKRREMGK